MSVKHPSYKQNDDKKVIYLDREKATKKELEDVKFLASLGYVVKLTSFKDDKKTVKGDKKPLEWFKEHLEGADLDEFLTILNDKNGTKYDIKKKREVKTGGFFNARKYIYNKHPELKDIKLTKDEEKRYLALKEANKAKKAK